MRMSGAASKTLEFGSWGEMLDYVGKEPVNPKSLSSRSGDKKFTGTDTFEEAMELALNGWEYATKQARALSSALFDKVSSMVERDHIVYDVEGLDIEMGAYTRNEPECWMQIHKEMEKSAGRIVRIVVNAGASAVVDKKTIIGRGAAVAALIELLDFAGTRCEVVTHSQFSKALAVRTLIKAADQPLDLARLMYAVGHPSMLRRLMFSALEHNPEQHEEAGIYGYGFPANAAEEQKGDVYLESMYGSDAQWTDAELAKQWVIDELRAQGVEIHEPAHS